MTSAPSVVKPSAEWVGRAAPNKVIDSPEEAVAAIKPGASVAIAGFGTGHRFPTSLIIALKDRAVGELTVVCNSLGAESEMRGQVLAANKQIKKLIAAFSARPGLVTAAEEQIKAGELEFELVPQGILVERLRAAAAGLGPFYSPVGVDTILAEGREIREFDGKRYVLEEPITVDFALLRGYRADRLGNVQFRGGSENFNPSFGKAARVTIVEVDEIVEPGEIDPGDVGLPACFVAHVDERTIGVEPPKTGGTRRQRKPESALEYAGKPGLTRSQMAERVARLLPEDSFVNLGVGIPTLVSNHLDGRNVYLHAENGILGYGSLIEGDGVDPDVYNASGEFVSLLPGASFFDSVESFEIARSGRLDAVVLGAYEVDGEGNLANWSGPGMAGGGVGGAMDLVANGRNVIAVLNHQSSKGAAKLVKRCTLPLTAPRCVDFIVTDLAVFARRGAGMVLLETAPGFTVDDIRDLTEMDFEVAPDVRPMASRRNESL